jgi:hypothetical protein
MKVHMAAASVALLAATAGHSATINPADYDDIYTEGKRVATVDGANVAGNDAVAGNGDVTNFGLGALAADTLLVGRVVNTGVDEWLGSGLTGTFGVNIINYAISSRNGGSPFEALFEVLINGTVASSVNLLGSSATAMFMNQSLGSFALAGDDVEVRITSAQGASDYDIELTFDPVAAVPVPAAGLLLLTALGGAGVMRRRKKA